MSWTPCTPEDVVIGDAVALSGRDPSGDPWNLSGRVRMRGETGNVVIEFTTRSGEGDPPWRLWANQLVRRDRLVSHGLRRHPAHGPTERTDEAGIRFLHDLAAGVDSGRLAACVQPGPGGKTIGEIAAREIAGRLSTAPEWALRQLDGRMTAADARAYVPVVQASRPGPQAAAEVVKRPAGPRLPDDHPVYADPEVAALMAALPGAYVRAVRERQGAAVETVGGEGG